MLTSKVYAQKDRLDNLFDSIQHQYPVESVYLHCDKYTALSGDTIWWKAYIFNGAFPSAISTNLHVELFNANNPQQPISQKLFPIRDNCSIGQLEIPDSLPQGTYWIRAYTSYQTNFDTTHLFMVPITVYNKGTADLVKTKKRVDPIHEPIVSMLDRLMLISTVADTGLICYLNADSGCKFFNKPLRLVMASYHQPLYSAVLTLTEKENSNDLVFDTKGLKGTVDLLLMEDSNLIARQSIFLGQTENFDVILSPDVLSTKPGGYNSWTVNIHDSLLYNSSVTVTDADRTSDQPIDILQAAPYDPFDYQLALKGHLPAIQRCDTADLSWTGTARYESGKPVRNGELIALISKDTSNLLQRPIVVPTDAQGHFTLDHSFFYDTAFLSFQLNSYENDPAAKKIQLSFVRPTTLPFHKPADSLWEDTSAAPHPVMASVTPAIPPGASVKVLPKVTVRHWKDVRRELNDRYATGMFSELTPYAFDVRTEKRFHSLWSYLRNQMPGLQGGWNMCDPPMLDGRKVILYVDDQLVSYDEIQMYWFEELAYIKVFPSFWVDDTPFMRFKTEYAGFQLKPTGSGPFKAPVQRDPPVICVYTRKGTDIRTGWAGLRRMPVAGYSPKANFTGLQENRTTLYWAPREQSNSFTVQFNNTTTTKRFRVTIEGVNKEGKLIHYEHVVTPTPPVDNRTIAKVKL